MFFFLNRSSNRDWLLHAAVLLAGCAMPLAFAPYENRWVVFLSLAVLFMVWREGAARVAALRGFLFGVGMFGFGVYWIYYSLHLFGDAVAPLAVVITIGFVAFFSGYIAALGWLIVRFLSLGENSRTHPLWVSIVLPAAWTFYELFRGWFLTGFPWLAIGYSQIDSWLAGYAPIIGVYGVSWVTAITAGLTCTLLVGRNLHRTIAGCLIVVIWYAGFVFGNIEWSEPDGEPLKIRMVQGNIEQHSKFMADLLIPSIDTYKALSETDEEVDLIIWPESAIPTFFYRIDSYLTEYAIEKLAQDTVILTGGFMYDKSTDRYYNSLRMLHDPDAYYHKQHLVPFGEYLPFRFLLEFLADLITIPMSDLSPGRDDFGRISVKGHIVAASICYEDAFGEEIIQQLPEAGLLINVSNDSWFGDSSAPYQHVEIARMRALEVARPMIRVTNTGISMVIDHTSSKKETIGMSKASANNAIIQPRQDTGTPYVRVGNIAVFLGVCFTALFSALLVGRMRGQSGGA